MNDDDRQFLVSTFPELAAFTYEHLPPHLQAVSRPFCELAWEVAGRWTQYPEVPGRESDMRSRGSAGFIQHHHVEAALSALMAAKDAAVRAVVPPPVNLLFTEAP